MNFCQCPNALYKVHPSISMAGGCEGCVWWNMVVDEILETNECGDLSLMLFLPWKRIQLQNKRIKTPWHVSDTFLQTLKSSHPSNDFKENHFPMQTPTPFLVRSNGKSSHPPWNHHPSIHPARGRSSDPNPTLPTTVGLQIQVPWDEYRVAVGDGWFKVQKTWKDRKSGCFQWQISRLYETMEL